MRLRGADFQLKNMLGRKTFWKSALRSGILFASPKAVQRPRLNTTLHFDAQNIYLIRMMKQNASARRLFSAALCELWPQVCRVKITFTLLPTNRFVSITTNSMKCIVN